MLQTIAISKQREKTMPCILIKQFISTGKYFILHLNVNGQESKLWCALRPHIDECFFSITSRLCSCISELYSLHIIEVA